MTKSEKHLVAYLVLAPFLVGGMFWAFGNFMPGEKEWMKILGSLWDGMFATWLLPGFPAVLWLALRADEEEEARKGQ